MIERVGPGPRKLAKLKAIREAQAQYLRLLRTFDKVRIPLSQFLMENGVCAENTKMPLGDELLAALRRANDNARSVAPANPANPAGAGGGNGSDPGKAG